MVVDGERYLDGHCSFRRSFFNKVHFNPEARGYQDTLFCSELYREGAEVVYLKNRLSYYVHLPIKMRDEKLAAIYSVKDDQETRDEPQ